MKRTKIILMLAGLMGSLGIVPLAPAEDSPNSDNKTQQFQGSVNSVDTKSMTLTVNNELLTITLDTQMTFKGKTIVLGDIAVGDRVLGTLQHTPTGRTEALTVDLQPLEKQPERKQ